MNKPQTRKLSDSSSMFLDGLRLTAALTVLFLHGRDQWFPGLAHKAHLPGNMAHAAVVVFFVLSG